MDTRVINMQRCRYGGIATFNAGVGEKARAGARIILEGIRSTTTETRTRQSNYVVWQSQVNQGSISKTLTLPSFTGPAKEGLKKWRTARV